MGIIPLLTFKRRKKLANIEEKIENLISTKIKNLGYDLYDVEYVKEGKDYFLRIYIDNSKGINIEDCEKVNNEITDILDSADYIKEQYFLEVSSPGIERTLRKDKHLKENIENPVQIKLFKNLNDKKIYKGTLKNFNEKEIEIEEKNQLIKIERKNISQIKTIYNW